jgi:hypothetical protein
MVPYFPQDLGLAICGDFKNETAAGGDGLLQVLMLPSSMVPVKNDGKNQNPLNRK